MQRLINGTRELGLELTPQQLQQFQLYYEALIDWNSRVNLTAVTNYHEVQVKHFLDSLALAQALADHVTKSDLSLVDVGSGAGFPGLPLKIVFPGINLVLIESTAKKAAFLLYLVGLLSLDNVVVISERAERVAHSEQYREQFDLAACRAVGPLAVAAELALPFCRQGGLFIAQKKGEISQELQKADKAIKTMGGEILRIDRLRLSSLQDRLLVMIAKVRPTPPRYPRRPGIPAKRPL